MPSLGTGEAFVFGSAVALPMQMTFSRLPESSGPSSDVGNGARGRADAGLDLIASVVERWRSATMSQRLYDDDSYDTGFTNEESPPVQPASTAGSLDPQRSRLLKQPLGAVLDQTARPKTLR